MTDPTVLKALESALAADPRNGALWLHYADLLASAGRHGDALEAVRSAAEITATRAEASRRLVFALVDAGKDPEALIRAENLLEADDDPELRVALAGILERRGDHEGAAEQRGRVQAVRPDLLEAAAPASSPPADAAPTPQAAAPAPSAEERAQDVDRVPAEATVGPDEDDQDWAKQFDWGDLHVTLDDVVGLDAVKRQIQLRIIAPFKQPEIYDAFGRQGGGGLLLYGPPGCGKTFIARATAGELGARFVAVSIHDIVDKYWGESEKAVHALFEEARSSRPTVLFFDEFDALGSKRGQGSQFWRTLVDQLLQEMDGVGSKNDEILMLAATNEPWGVDSAFRRPGRFDRVLFVPPPDLEGREALLKQYGKSLPGFDRIGLGAIAKKAELYTGADMKSLCERAAEGPLERSLQTGKVHEVGDKDFQKALKTSRSTAMEWIGVARNHARYANEGGHYDELVEWLKGVKKWS